MPANYNTRTNIGVRRMVPTSTYTALPAPEYRNFEPMQFYVNLTPDYQFRDKVWPQGRILPHFGTMIDPASGVLVTCYTPGDCVQLERDYNSSMLIPLD
jgi:hypothetical protein